MEANGAVRRSYRRSLGGLRVTTVAASPGATPSSWRGKLAAAFDEGRSAFRITDVTP